MSTARIATSRVPFKCMPSAAPLASRFSTTSFSQIQGFSLLSKSFLAITAAFAAFADPNRADMVATLGETTGTLNLARIRDEMLLDRSGRRILRERPVLNSSTVNLDHLRSLPTNTLGYSYAVFMGQFGLSPDRTPIKYMENDEIAYVMQRYREIHDFFHVITGLSVSVEDEIALKWFEWTQFGLPVAALSSLVGPLRLSSTQRRRLLRDRVPWAVQCGSRSKLLMAVYWEDLLEKDLNLVRKELGIWLPPDNRI